MGAPRLKCELLVLACALGLLPALADAQTLRAAGRTDLPGYQGDFDHFGADVAGDRLFLAGEDGGTLEVFSLRTGARLKTVTGLEAPHAVHFDRARNRIVVSDSGPGLTKVLDGRSYAVTGTLALAPGADSMTYDPGPDRLWLVTGGKNASPRLPRTTLNQVDAATGKVLREVGFDTDFTEGMVAERQGSRLFVNVAGRNEIAVLDKSDGKVIATWPVKEGEANSQIDLDEANQRLFLITRKPFKLVVFDTARGVSVASFEAPPRANGVVYDARNHRIYVPGDGYVSVVEQQDRDHYREVERVPSEYGAKTGFLAPEVNRLYLAVGGSDKGRAGLLAYDVLPSRQP